MPSAETFTIEPVAALLARWLGCRSVIVDPFARDSRIGTHRNDLNPATAADWHLDARDFLRRLAADGVEADAVLFDPPYSPRQIAEVYQQIGRPCSTEDTQNARLYREVRDLATALLRPGGVAISCGWNSSGFGVERGFTLREVLIVAHGGAHNDTIVTVETYDAAQAALPFFNERTESPQSVNAVAGSMTGSQADPSRMSLSLCFSRG